MLTAVGQPITAAMRDYVDRPDPIPPNSHDYIRLYSDSLRDLVAERDGVIIAKYNYRFGS